MRQLRIALLAHSTNPRGGVVHALELGDALSRLGHDVTVHAPDAKKTGFFRPSVCKTVSVPTSPYSGNTTDMVRARINDYLTHFETPAHRHFDVFHAQDGISGNALATLKARGLIQRFARTVHHIDDFADPELMALQIRAISESDSLFVVSRTWQDELNLRYDRSSCVIGNGVDCQRFSQICDGREESLRARLGLGEGPVFLAIGGVEERKNSIGILLGFALVRQAFPNAQLVIAGGATVLDHHDYQERFAVQMAEACLPEGAIRLAGSIAQADMPALYRIADTLVFPSLREGFGLVVLEAMASGIPVVTSRIAPFTEYLGVQDVAWCDPLDHGSIGNAMLATLRANERHQFIENGVAVAARHDWRQTAVAHLDIYDQIREFHFA